MSPRKGGIGRRPGKKPASRQKHKSITSLTATKKKGLQIQQEIGKKLMARRERRKSNVTINVSMQSNLHNNRNIAFQVELY